MLMPSRGRQHLVLTPSPVNMYACFHSLCPPFQKLKFSRPTANLEYNRLNISSTGLVGSVLNIIHGLFAGMEENGLRIGGNSSRLAVILDGKVKRENSQKSHLVSYCDNIGDKSMERTLEHIFGLPHKSIGPLNSPVDNSLVHSFIRNDFFFRLHASLEPSVKNREGVHHVVEDGCGSNAITFEKTSICGDIRTVKAPFLMEILALFSSARANAHVWKGKWMYEVILETFSIQRLGWATLSCPFTNHKGVGDVKDWYAFDG